MTNQNQRLIERALDAYLRSDGISAPQPGALSSVETVGGLAYVILRGDRGVVAVYRVNPRGRLERKRRLASILAGITKQNPMGRESARERVGDHQTFEGVAST